jgi:hypothetical protein
MEEIEEALAEAGVDAGDVAEAEETEEVEEEEFVPAIEDLSRSLVDIVEPAPVQPAKKKPSIVVVRPTAPEKADDDDEAAKRKTRKGRHLEYDEKSGEVVVKRKRKDSRRTPGWDDEF